jgi:DNA-binding GntR family transcriptional regulator
MRKPAPTLAATIQQRLTDEIAQGMLKPGVHLEEIELANRFNVSRTPIREALRHLAASGIVEVRPRRGVVVADLTSHRVFDLLEVIADLEAASARYAAVRMTKDERSALKSLHESLAGVVAHEDFAAYDSGNVAFHYAIHAGAHNKALLDAIESMRQRIVPYTRVEFMRHGGRVSVSYSEHEAVVSAILRGDAELAYYAMRAHVVEAGKAPEDLTLDNEAANSPAIEG